MRRNNLLSLFRRAFTLVELIIVIVILGLLAAISIVGYQSVVDRADQAAAETTLASVDREYRALAAFNMAADSSAGVPIADMTVIDGIDYTAGDTDSDGLLEPGETVTFDGVVLTLSAATTPGSITGTAGSGASDGSGGSSGSGTPFSVAYSQQSFDISGSSQALSPTITGATGLVTYAITSGTLPADVTFSAATGEFTGPTALNMSATAVSVGQFHSCALLDGGSVQCWGDNNNTQTEVPATVTDATAISASGWRHSCALISDSTVQCWGYNNYGQTTVPASLPPADAIAVGGYHSCALLSDSTVQCWGRNDSGQATLPSSASNVSSVSAGGYHTCAVHSGGEVSCWGHNGYGQRTVPSTLPPAIAVSAGLVHTCALLSDGTVQCWGRDDQGQSTVPTTLSNVTAVSAGPLHTCALLSDGTIECWGLDDSGQSSGPALAAVEATSVATGYYHTCASLSDSTVSCWGSNTTPWGPNHNGQSTPPAFGNPGFPATIEIEATDGTNTATFTVELTVS